MARKSKFKSEKISVDSDKSSDKNIKPEQIGEDTNSIFTPEGELVVDIFETNSDFVILTAIAGVQIKDLDIAVEKDMMVIRGNRLNPDDSPGRKYFYQECYWGPFSKKVVLPENIDVKTAVAQIDKGILTVKIPKIMGNNDNKDSLKLS